MELTSYPTERQAGPLGQQISVPACAARETKLLSGNAFVHQQLVSRTAGAKFVDDGHDLTAGIGRTGSRADITGRNLPALQVSQGAIRLYATGNGVAGSREGAGDIGGGGADILHAKAG